MTMRHGCQRLLRGRWTSGPRARTLGRPAAARSMSQPTPIDSPPPARAPLSPPGIGVPDEDAPLVAALPDGPLRPIFILGLHRSGTTFLYEALDRLLPAASLRAWHIAFYPRLLAGQADGRGAADRAAFDAYFRALGLRDRQIDAIALTAETVEEYGWVLRRYGRSFKLEPKSDARFREMCKKLLALEGEPRGVRGGEVLLKNPWDTGEAASILARYPEARFVCITRDPIRIAASQWRNSLLFGSAATPYLDLLLEGFGLGKAVIRGQKLLYRVAGRERYAAVMLRWILKDVARELARYRAAVAALPGERWVEVPYERLVERPAEVLGRVVEFLGLEPRVPLDTIEPRPRERALDPALERRRAAFEARLEALDLRDPTRLLPTGTPGGAP